MKNKHGHHVTVLKKKGYKRGLNGQATGIFKKYACFMDGYRKGVEARKKQKLINLVLKDNNERISKYPEGHVNVKMVHLK